MGVNHVNFSNGESAIDLRGDTISPEVVLKGFIGHDKSGNQFTGTKEFKTQTKAITPTKSQQNVTPDSGIDALSGVTVNAIPSNYVDTSGTTAVSYDIYNGKTAYVNGELVTGAYKFTGWGSDPQWNSNSTGCSSSKLVVPCPFAPKAICALLNSGTHNTNTIIVAFFISGACTYHSRTSSGVIRNQYTSSTSNYFSYDSTNKKVTLNRPNTSYNWSSQNYRVACFK